MKAMLADAANIAALSSATTPEEFAKRFKAAATTSLAKSIAEALDETVKTASTTFASNSAIAGWEKLVGGMIGTFTWDRYIGDTSPMISLSSYEARSPSALATFGITWSAGVSIGGSF